MTAMNCEQDGVRETEGYDETDPFRGSVRHLLYMEAAQILQ